MKSLSHVQLLATPWTAAHQAPPSMGFSRQEYWSGVHRRQLLLVYFHPPRSALLLLGGHCHFCGWRLPLCQDFTRKCNHDNLGRIQLRFTSWQRCWVTPSRPLETEVAPPPRDWVFTKQCLSASPYYPDFPSIACCPHPDTSRCAGHDQGPHSSAAPPSPSIQPRCQGQGLPHCPQNHPSAAQALPSILGSTGSQDHRTWTVHVG